MLPLFHFVWKRIFIMILSWLIIFTIFVVILLSSTIADDPCRFVTSKGVIDLTSLARTDGTPAYLDKYPATGSNFSNFFVKLFALIYFLIIEYSYNPCKPFSEGNTCMNVAACQG